MNRFKQFCFQINDVKLLNAHTSYNPQSLRRYHHPLHIDDIYSRLSGNIQHCMHIQDQNQ